LKVLQVVGPVAAEVSSQAIESFLAYKKNLEWAKSHRDNLEEYAGKFVAVSNGRVLEVGESGVALEQKYGDIPGVYIAVVVRRGTRWVL
jgi:hypothetical protein